MRTETLSVREAREQLPSLLERFRRGDREPVYLGSHRRTEAVMLPVEIYDELMAHRQNAADQSVASLRLEGYTPNPAVEIIIERWVHGEMTDAEMERQVHALYGVGE
jgi:PHD/YefM family antitoxin component YafN of YafNO toxin-antitoxin module